MNKVLFLVVVSILLVSAGSLAAQGTGSSAGYNPSTVYHGDYSARIVYYSASTSKVQSWRRIPKLDRLSYISCQEALDQLSQNGTWKGHLGMNGSCLPSDEPADWAMGNWLNYQDSTGTSGR